MHELSRIDHILNALIEEVEGNGPIRRVQTFLDSSLHHIEEQSLLILRQRDQLSMLLPQCESGLTYFPMEDEDASRCTTVPLKGGRSGF